MDEKGLEQRKILENYISENYNRYEKESLEGEAIKKGYSKELFEEIFSKVSNEKNKQENKQVEKQIIITHKEKPKGFFEPTQVMTYSFCLILLLVVGFGLADTFSLEALTSGDVEGFGSSFKIGYPFVFFSVSMDQDGNFDFGTLELIADFILYLILAYILDLMISNSFIAIKSSIKKDNDEEKLDENLENQEIAFKNKKLNL